MSSTRKHSGIVLLGTAHLDGHLDSDDMTAIEFTLTQNCIHMHRPGRDRDGNLVENEITIESKWQAMAALQIIKAMSAANGWEV
jgi:hypothetical protein